MYFESFQFNNVSFLVLNPIAEDCLPGYEFHSDSGHCVACPIGEYTITVRHGRTCTNVQNIKQQHQ